MKKIFTLISLMVLAITASAQIGSYMVPSGETPKGGQEVTSVAGITMIYGNENGADKSWKNANEARVKSVTIGGVEYSSVAQTKGDENPVVTITDPETGETKTVKPTLDNCVPDFGTYFAFKSASNGVLYVMCTIGANKNIFFVDNGTAVSALVDGVEVQSNGTIAAKSDPAIITMDIKSGHTYYVYCTSSKLGLYGFIYDNQGQGSTVESYMPTDEAGFAKPEWPASVAEGQQNVVDIDATANVHFKAVSGAITDWNEGETLPLTPKFGNNWDVKNNRGNVWDEKLGATKTLYFLNGMGNPTSGVAFVEKRTDGQKTGVWRRCFDKTNDPEGPYYAEDGVTEITDPNFYYQPDGSAGLPSKYGVFYQVTAKTAGTMKFLVWNNKGTRLVYVADGSTGVALNPLKGEVKYSGYVNGQDEWIDPADESKGKRMIFFENLVPQEGKEYCPQAEINANQAAWVYLTFEMEAGKTYYIFNHNTQLGFGGFEFTFEDTPTPVAEESYVPTDEAGVAKPEWPATVTEGQQNVVDIDATANVHFKAVSGAITDWNEGETLPLAPKYGNNWDVKNNRGNVWDEKLGATKTLYFLNGMGNPTSGVAFVEKRTDGQKTGVWRRCFDKTNDPEGPYYAEDGVTEITDPNFYYQPDGSAGLPSKYGVFYQVTAKTAGTMKFLVWNNKGTRLVYVADGSTGVALNPLKGEVKYSGYVNGQDEWIDPADESKGKRMIFFENLVPQEGKEYCPQAEINAGQAAWIYLTFEMEAGKTYYIFNHNTQLGFGGFTFTPGGVGPTPEPNPEGNLLNEQSYNFNEGIGAWYGWGTGSYEQAKPGYEGSAGCLHLTSPAAGDAWSSQLAYNVALEQGQDYTMSFVAKAKNDGGKIQFSYQNSTSYAGGGYMDINLTTDWAPYTFHWDAISQTDAMDRFTINYGAVANEYFIDRVCLIKGKPTGIEEVNIIDMKKPVDNRVFNLQGVQVDKNYKGVVIMNGRRFLQR